MTTQKALHTLIIPQHPCSNRVLPRVGTRQLPSPGGTRDPQTEAGSGRQIGCFHSGVNNTNHRIFSMLMCDTFYRHLLTWHVYVSVLNRFCNAIILYHTVGVDRILSKNEGGKHM